MTGILADINVIGQVAYLTELMQVKGWEDFWKALGLTLVHFADVGLSETSKDVEIWQCCQANQLILITDNRNDESADSLNPAIRQFGTPQSLPVFTIADLNKFGYSREYEERVVAALYDFLMRIEELRGTGRLYLP